MFTQMNVQKNYLEKCLVFFCHVLKYLRNVNLDGKTQIFTKNNVVVVNKTFLKQ